MHWRAGYGDLTSVVYGANGPGHWAEISLVPVAGYEIALLGFDLGCWFNSAECQTLEYAVNGLGGAAIASGFSVQPAGGHGSVTFGSPTYATDGILLSWGSMLNDYGSNYGALDNLVFDVRAIGSHVGAVPEPATWAMMILGFGMVGGAMRRRGQNRGTTRAREELLA